MFLNSCSSLNLSTGNELEHLSTDGAATIEQNDLYDASTRLSCLPPLCLVYMSSGASNFCHVQPILQGCLSNFARLSEQFWDRNFPISPSDFVQCDYGQSDDYKNRTDGLAKSVRQQKLDQFWLFHVNKALLSKCNFIIWQAGIISKRA